MAEYSSEDENLAAMLAFDDDSDVEEREEEHETSQGHSHGYNVDDFVVHDDDAVEVKYPRLRFPICIVPSHKLHRGLSLPDLPSCVMYRRTSALFWGFV